MPRGVDRQIGREALDDIEPQQRLDRACEDLVAGGILRELTNLFGVEEEQLREPFGDDLTDERFGHVVIHLAYGPAVFQELKPLLDSGLTLRLPRPLHTVRELLAAAHVIEFDRHRRAR